jgi:antitoxin MazE
MPLVHVKKNYQITLPHQLRDTLKLKEGDLLEAEVKGESIVLTPKSVVDRIEEKRQEWVTSLMKIGKEHPVDVSEEEIVRESKRIRRELYQEEYGKN